VTGMNAGANAHKLELVKEVKECLNKLEIQRQLDVNRDRATYGGETSKAQPTKIS